MRDHGHGFAGKESAITFGGRMNEQIAGRFAGLWLWMIAATACATGGAVGSVNLSSPQPAHGDDQAIAWPFTLVHGGEAETVAGFYLRIDDGGALLAVRPDAENPDAGARFHWRGELRNGAGHWTGDPLIPGDGVTLTILLRPDPGTDPRLRVTHWPTDGRDQAVGPEDCEIWRYDTASQKVATEGC